jgi:hypothetical protein
MAAGPFFVAWFRRLRQPCLGQRYCDNFSVFTIAIQMAFHATHEVNPTVAALAVIMFPAAKPSTADSKRLFLGRRPCCTSVPFHSHDNIVELPAKTKQIRALQKGSKIGANSQARNSVAPYMIRLLETEDGTAHVEVDIAMHRAWKKRRLSRDVNVVDSASGVETTTKGISKQKRGSKRLVGNTDARSFCPFAPTWHVTARIR